MSTYSAIELTEFVVRSRQKVAELSLEITTLSEHEGMRSKRIMDLVDLSVELIDVCNLIESNYVHEQVDYENLYKILDYYNHLAALSEKPLVMKDPFNKLDRPAPAVVQNRAVSLPEGSGYLYMTESGELKFVAIESSAMNVLRGLKSDFDLVNPVLPKDSMVIVRYAAADGKLVYKIKVGDGKAYADTPFVDGRERYQAEYPETAAIAPEGFQTNRFLTEIGWQFIPEYTAKDMDSHDLTTRKTLSETDYNKLQEILNPYMTPVIKSLTGNFVTLQVGKSYAGPLAISMSLDNPANVATLSLAASAGDWKNLGAVTPAATISKSLELNAALSLAKMGSVDITTVGTDSKGNALNSKKYVLNWWHLIHYGSSENPNVKDPALLTNKGQVLTDRRQHTFNFNPVGQQYQLVFIPTEIVQTGIDIRNKQALAFAHSMGMNLGDGGTVPHHTASVGGIQYNVYVTYNTTDAGISCEVQ